MDTIDDPQRLARLMWTHFEPVHAITYFHPRSRAAYEAAGLRGTWRGYFAGRAAPLGAVAAAPVVAAFFGFAPDMVARALPSVWQLATPQEALRTRLTGAVQALAELTYDLPETQLAEAAELLEAAAGRLDHAGRLLGAVNAALPRPDQPLGRLWQAATTLREHRGDGHIAALVTAGLDGPESLVWRASLDMTRQALQPYRGWTDDEWQAALDRLTVRGWLTPEGQPTETGRTAFQAIEEATDRAAAGPWRALDPAEIRRLRELLAPIARACYTVLPASMPISLPAPVG
ncbi:hypothetical protein GCM10027290_49850 [Micromonospora sonneratiae]